MLCFVSSSTTGLLSVHVSGKVLPKSQDSFYAHTLRNATNSVKEPGISRFDVLSKIDCDDEFLLIEVYNSDDAPLRHKETSHYNSWREDVADMMAELELLQNTQLYFQKTQTGWLLKHQAILT